MFWSETGGEARIGRAGMDGSDRRVLIKDGLRWPASLAVDSLGQRIYWTDEKLKCIGSATLDGGDIKVLYSHIHSGLFAGRGDILVMKILRGYLVYLKY